MNNDRFSLEIASAVREQVFQSKGKSVDFIITVQIRPDEPAACEMKVVKKRKRRKAVPDPNQMSMF